MFGRALGTALPYMLSIAVTKGVSLAMVPWIAAHLPPSEYGRIEVVGSVVEFASLLFACGLADTLFRFAGGGLSEGERRARAAAIAGSAVVQAAVCALILQACAGFIQDLLALQIGTWAFRASLMAAAVGGMIELPLAWLRLRERPFRYLAFCALRAGLQFVVVGWAVWREPVAESVLMATAAVEIAMAAALLIAQVRDTGLRFSSEALRWALGYSLPLVLGSVATFAVGACDRWFLVGQVPTADIGLYGIANKIALATSLVMQPFGLWWYARRLRVLEEPDGLQRSAQAVSLGFVILIVGAVVASLTGPAFIRLVLPAAYLPATALIPGLVAVSFLNETASLLNVGCYARRTAWSVSAVNLAGAIVAIAGYVVLIPYLGVEGAIAATVAAHAVRIAGFLTAGHWSARIPYQSLPIAALAATAVAGVALAMRLPGLGFQLLTALALPPALVGLAWAGGLVRLPGRRNADV